MTSLRSRLILGSSLIALAPLALVTFLLSQRIEDMVRSDANERLDRALGGLQVELAAESSEIAQKLEILARDVTLKRLYLLRSGESRDLEQYLEEKRFLLGLDFLAVGDRDGASVARADARAGAPDRLGIALSASAPILYQGERAGALLGGVALDSTFLRRLERIRGIDLSLQRGDRLVASTLPIHAAYPLPAAGRRDVTRAVIEGRSYLTRGVALDLGAVRPTILGFVPAEAADRTIRALQISAALLALLGVALAIVLGTVWSSQVSRPVETLAAISERLSRGEWDDPVTVRSVGELQRLVAALERMRADLRRYREQLVIGERHVAWSQMARKVAHEIKNPLTPIAISIADLKRSFEQKRPDFPLVLDQAVRTIGDEVHALTRLLDEFSELGRFPAPVFAPCDVGDLFADLGALYAREVEEGRLSAPRPSQELTISADAAQLRQALINLIKNGLEATGGHGRVTLAASAARDGVEITVSDDGPGLSPEQRAHLFVPGFTTKSTGSGLGLTIVERIVHDHRGAIAAESAPDGGTTFRIDLPGTPRSASWPRC